MLFKSELWNNFDYHLLGQWYALYHCPKRVSAFCHPWEIHVPANAYAKL